MVQAIALYFISVVIFLGLDAVAISRVIRPLFERHLGGLLADPMRVAPAVLFYLSYVAGVLWMVSLPALKDDAPLQALVGGMVLGFLCYGTYELTNYATLAAWSWQQVAVDLAWGTILTGVTAWSGVAILVGRLA